MRNSAMQWHGHKSSAGNTSKRTDGDIDHRRRHPRSKRFNTRQVVVAFGFSLWNIMHWRWQEDTITIFQPFDEDNCSRAIMSSTNNTAIDFMSIEERERAIQFATKISMNSTLKGDYVEVDISPTLSCSELGGISLVVAIAQRTAVNEPYCNRLMVPRRAVWLAFRDERCIEVVSKLFHENKFSVVDPINSLDSSNGSVDAPTIHLLVGPILQTLSDAPVKNIALLRVGHPLLREMDESVMAVHDEQLTTNTLHALISLYRKVGIGGYVALDGVWLGEVKEFLIDGNHTIIHVSTDSTSFVKSDNQIRIPRHYRQSQIASAVDAKVLRAWETLNDWHNKTGKRFVGHVGTNAYQTYRYAEAMRQVIDTQKKRSEVSEEVTVNVCETGFNGGHSAMLFMSFLNKEQGVNVNYWGWDLKAVGSASPTADKMTVRYGDNFHIVWGDSKVTLKEAKNTMGDQVCHLIVVDGDHSKEGVVNDLQNFLDVAAPGAIVFGDDCAPYKRTVPQSEKMLEGWMEFVNYNLLISVANYRNPDLPSPGFVEGVVPDI